VWHSIADTFGGKSQGEVAGFFGSYVSLESIEPIIFWVVCLLLNTWILSRGLSGGVEKAAKIGMPLLLIFGAFLAYKAVTIQAGEHGAIFDGLKGLDFLWTPKFDTIWEPKVWLAAAGQIFFTLSIGMGSIQCYASYVRSKDDIALNAMSAGWMNGFVEVVLGSAILIPISVGYLGIDGLKDLISEGGGLGLGFKTLPYLFEQWGGVLGVAAGVAWFGLLFFAGITSSLAMGTPVMGFLQDEFGWKEKNAAWMFGFAVLILGLPTVLFFNNGVFDEYDYWAGTVSLVLFAFVEIILFSWIFGMKKGWQEIITGADIKVIHEEISEKIDSCNPKKEPIVKKQEEIKPRMKASEIKKLLLSGKELSTVGLPRKDKQYYARKIFTLKTKKNMKIVFSKLTKCYKYYPNGL
jgi:SNF family Na+-dependent transporter